MARHLAPMLSVLLTSMLCAQSLPEDPVVRARMERAKAQGIQESDLPAVPRAVMEPPPLPPPETHPKDLRKSKRSRTSRVARSSKSRKTSAKKAPKTASRKAAPAKKRTRKR